MKKGILLFWILLGMTYQLSYSQYLIRYEKLRSFTPAQVDSVMIEGGLIPGLIIPQYEVDVYKIVYNTVSFDSSKTIASGAIAVPKGVRCLNPLISYQHGTKFVKKEDAMSEMGGEFMIGLISASADGYPLIMADLLGFGESPLSMHPYVHAESEATAVIDMIRASKEFLKQLNFVFDDKLLMFGYSQGGHSTMAAHKKMEESFPDEFNILASAPMSGPYSISEEQAKVIINDSAYSQPVFLPYVVLSYNMVYKLFDSPTKFFAPPYDTLLPPLFNGMHYGGDIDTLLPRIPNKMILPSVFEDFKKDMNHPFRKALQANDLIDWLPKAPLKMYYCEADEQVVYTNALVAYESFRRKGKKNVWAQSMGENNTHVPCALYSILDVRNWFDSYKEAGHVPPTIQKQGNVTFCANDPVGLTLSTQPRAGLHIRWFKDGYPIDTLASLRVIESGVYTVRLHNGCSGTTSKDTIVATVLPVTKPTITQPSGTTLESSDAKSYQWYEGATPQMIAGATAKTFTPTKSGKYMVRATFDNGCTADSDPQTFIMQGTDEFHTLAGCSIFPNPSPGTFVLQSEGHEVYTVRVQSLTGATLLEFPWNSAQPYMLDMNGYSRGVYQVVIEGPRSQRLIRKVVKL